MFFISVSRNAEADVALSVRQGQYPRRRRLMERYLLLLLSVCWVKLEMSGMSDECFSEEEDFIFPITIHPDVSG